MIKQFHKKINILIILIIVFMFLFQNVVNCDTTSDAETGETIESTETEEDEESYVDYSDDEEYLDDNDDYSEILEADLEEDSESEESESSESDSTSESSSSSSSTSGTSSTTSTTTSSNTNGNEAIIEKAQEIIEVMAAGNWKYEHGVSGRKTWEDAKKRKTSSCATFVTWVLQETGYLTKGKIISHKKYGTSFSSVKNSYDSNLTDATWYDLTGSKIKTSSYDDLLPGDVVIVEKKGSWRSIAIYAGKNSSGKNLYYGAVSNGALRTEYAKNGGKGGAGEISCFDNNNLVIVIRFDGGNTTTSSSSSLETFFLNLGIEFFTWAGDLAERLMANTGNTEKVKLTYSAEEIEADSELSEEINVQYSSETEDDEQNSEILKEITISSVIETNNGSEKTVYTTDTEIPVIPVDIYSLSLEKVDMLDTEFIASNDNENKVWNFVDSIVDSLGRVMLYVAAALVLTMLICRGVLIVTSSIRSNPQVDARSKKILNNLVKTIVLMICVYVVMSCITYLYEYVLSIFVGENPTSYTIRVNVENVYSFNTNFTGYLRFLSLRENAPRAALGFAFLYAVVAWALNGGYFVIMSVRMGVLAVLTVIAPLTAVNAMYGNKTTSGKGIGKILNFRIFLITYTGFTCGPLLAVLIVRALTFI